MDTQQNPIIRSVRPIDVFVSNRYSEVDDGVRPTGLAKCVALTNAFTKLSRADRLDFENKAKAENDILDQLRQLDFKDLIDSPLLSNLRRHLKTTMLRNVAVNALKQLQNHSMRDEGSALDGFGTGLRPGLVVGGSQEAVTKRLPPSSGTTLYLLLIHGRPA